MVQALFIIQNKFLFITHLTEANRYEAVTDHITIYDQVTSK